MSRPRRAALVAGYAVSFVAVLLALIAAFGYLGAWEAVLAAALAVPTTVAGDRALRRAIRTVEPATPPS